MSNQDIEKYCIDCKHKRSTANNRVSDVRYMYFCSNPKIITKDIVTSESIPTFCFLERNDTSGRCKSTGIYFEPREKLSYFIELWSKF
jgi:hypothetical protein